MKDENKEKSYAPSVTDKYTVRVLQEFSSEKIGEFMESNRYGIALLLASTKAESILFSRLRREFDIPGETFVELFKREGLNTYYEWCKKLDLVRDKYMSPIKKLNKERNRLVHVDGYLQRLQEDREKRKEVKRILKRINNFIDDAEPGLGKSTSGDADLNVSVKTEEED